MSNATIEVKETKKIEREGVYTVKLSQIDNTVYTNQRTERDPSKMLELFKSLKGGPQLNTVTCEWKEDGQRLNLVAGFGRIEAFERIALEKLVKEWNASHELQSTDENFLRLDMPEHRHRILNAGGEWEQKYIEAMDSQMVNVTTIIVGEEKGEAELTNLAENVIREDLSLMDLCRSVHDLVDAGVKQTLIARKLGKQEAQVSQYKKLAEFPTYLRTRFRDELPSLYKDESKLVEIADIAEKALAEYERRLKLPKDATASVSFSHARDFVNAVNNKKNPLPIGHTLTVLRYLVRMDESGTLNPMSPVMDYAVFKDQLNATVKTAQKFGDEVLDAQADQVAANQTAKTAEPANAVSVQDVASAQAAVNAAIAASGVELKDVDRGTLNSVKDALNKEAGVNKDESLVDIQPGDADGDDIDANEIMDDLIGDDPSDGELESLESSGVNIDLLGKSGNGAGDGATRVSTVDRGGIDDGVSPYKLKEAHTINQYANQYLAHTMDADTPLSEIQPYLFAAGELKSVIGLEQEFQDIGVRFNTYSTVFNAYFAKMEEVIDKYAGKELPLEVVKSLKMMRPTSDLLV